MTAARLALPLRRARLGERLAALAVAATLVVSASPASAHIAPPNAQEIERLYLEGQDHYAAKDFKGAAEAWTRLLNLMPESGTNQATRENVLINILTAHLDAYRRMRNEDGSRQIEHLREGKKTLDQYYADFKQVHGDRTAVSAAVQEKGDEIELELTKAEEELAAAAARDEDGPDPVDPPGGAGAGAGGGDGGKEVVVVPGPQENGTGLLVGGSVVAVLGIAALAMIPIGVVRGRNAARDFDDGRDEGNMTKMDQAKFEGEQANKVLISGAILTPLLLGGAAALLAFGIIKRRQAHESRLRASKGVTGMSPVFDRSFAGFALQGRF